MSHILSPTTIKSLCNTYHLSPSKKYGQNYLISRTPIEKMLAAAHISKEDTVIEIGPGFGILTFALAEKAKKVIAFEIEKKLQSYWEEKQRDYPNVEVVWGNALHMLKADSPRPGPKGYQLKAKSYKVIANLPYQITSHVLRTLLERDRKPKTITVMVQKEVAQRICAHPGDMSLLAVSVQYYGTPRVVAKVPKGNFWPQPKVDSAIVHIDTIHDTSFGVTQDRLYATQTSDFFRVVRAGFANKRKQLWRNLSEGLGMDAQIIKHAVRDSAGDEKVRAQELSVGEWKALTGTIHDTRHT